MRILNLIMGLFLAVPVFSLEKSPFLNIKDIIQQLGFESFYSVPPIRQLSVAVLDQGFYDYEKEIGRTLPAGTQYHKGLVSSPPDSKNEHGKVMAQILTALMSNNGAYEKMLPELHLYNVYGYTNFKNAISDIIARKIDIVLYSEVWEYGSNWDGKGFFNEEVSRATNEGVIWINAAGNFANRTYNSSIVSDEESWVRLPDENKSLAIKCDIKAKDGKCSLRIGLSWSDFSDDVNTGTEKDLDLVLTDDLLNIVQTAGLKQSIDPAEERPGYSKYPREILTAEVKKGLYYIRVKDRSHNFKKSDRLRITVDGDHVTVKSHSEEETLLNPADNMSVITVGASDSDRSSSSVILKKPEIIAPSSIRISSSEEYRGSSNAAAVVAAGVSILKSLNPLMTKEDLLKRVSKNDRGTELGNKSMTVGSGRGLPVQMLGFGFTGPGCFYQFPLQPNASLSPNIQELLEKGGVLVQTAMGVRVMVDFDPLLLDRNLSRQWSNDMVVSSVNGYRVYPRYAAIPMDVVEVFQTPINSGLCSPAGGTAVSAEVLPSLSKSLPKPAQFSMPFLRSF